MDKLFRNPKKKKLNEAIREEKEFEFDGLHYTTIGHYAAVDRNENASGKISIPEKVSDTEGKEYPVKCIRLEAFLNCKSLISVEIPPTVDIIAKHAFENCTSLQSVMFQNSTECKDIRISESAFKNCKSLTQIIPPSSLKIVEKFVFVGCESLKGISLPGVIRIDASAFEGCAALEKLYFIDKLKYIKYRAFANCTSLKSFRGYDTLVFIESEAFAGCTALVNVALPKDCKTEADSFKDAPIEKDTYKAYKDAEKEDHEYIKKYEKEREKERREEERQNKQDEKEEREERRRNKKNNKNNDEDEYDEDEDEDMEESFKDRLNRIINEVGKGKRKLVSESSVESIQNATFNFKEFNCELAGNKVEIIGCTINAGNVVVPEKVSYQGQKYTVTSIGDCTFAMSDIESVVLPETIENIGEEAFSECYNLVSINFPKSLKSIGDNAFSYCNKLKVGNVPSSCNVGNGAFEGTIKESLFSKRKLNESTNDESFEFKGINYKTISESEAEVGRNETAKGEINIPEKVNDPNGKEYTVTSIGEEAFMQCRDITSIILPKSITSIGDYAFLGCHIASIMLPESLTSIGIHALAFTKLKSVIIPDSVINIGDHMFAFCGNLRSVKLPATLKEIKDGMFYSCKPLTSINIPDGVTNIGEEAFGLCYNLTKITLPNSVKNIEEKAFYNCRKLKEINIPEGCSIGENAFQFTLIRI